VTAEGADAAPPPPPPARIVRGPRGRVRVAHAVRASRHAAAERREKSAPQKQARAEKGTPKRTVRVASLKKHVR
jgi:hypothetical protein